MKLIFGDKKQIQQRRKDEEYKAAYDGISDVIIESDLSFSDIGHIIAMVINDVVSDYGTIQDGIDIKNALKECLK